MNCPYCDESIHPSSKFCPKCGLPLKEDSTVMGTSGAYVSDDAGWNPLVVGGAAVGIVVVALAIGWMSARKDNVPVETVRREPAGTYGIGGQAPVGMQFAPAPSAWAQSPASTAAVGPVWTPNVPVKWAWQPPAQTGQPHFTVPAPDPTPPPQPLIAMNRVLTYQAPSVTVAQSTVPAVPALPPLYYPASALVGVAAPEPASLEETGIPPTAGAVGANNEPQYIWDPVQERYARNPEWRPARRSSRPQTSIYSRMRGAPQGAFGSTSFVPGGVAYPTYNGAPGNGAALPSGIPSPSAPANGGLDGVNSLGQ